MGVKDVDSHKLSFHPKSLCKWLNNEPIAPLHIELGITNRCNHRCKFCTLNWINHGGVDIDKKIMIQTIEDFAEMGVKSIYFAGEGEPTLHKDLAFFIEKAYDLGIKIAISTNGSLFDNNLANKILGKLSWIRFSLDAFKPSTFKELHGVGNVEFYKVLENIASCVKIKRENKYSVEIGVQAIFESANCNEMVQLCEMVKDIGVDNFQVKPAHDHPKSSYHPGFYDYSGEIKNSLEKIETEDFKVIVRLKSLERIKVKRNYKECHGFNFYGLIDANGSVVPCNIFYNNPEFIYGNINDNRFKDIWFSERRKSIMEKIYESNHQYCAEYRCRLDVMNRYLERVKNPERNDDFI